MLLPHARYLVAIADHGSFTRGDVLHVSHDTASASG
jgi:DNA-binding transcriptional LysR family regulator